MKGLKKRRREWLKIVARKEENPYMQAEFLYQALDGPRPKGARAT
jgi:hypothetical protein